MTFLQDLRYGVRVLMKSPGFAIIAILTLALGIGANSTIFSWINSTVLNPIPGVTHASHYAAITIDSGRNQNPLSYQDYLDLRDRTRTLSSFLAASSTSMSLTSNGKPERRWGILASANYFTTLGVHPILGRGFLPSEDTKPDGAPVVVISYHLWQTRFGGDPSVIGRTIQIDRHPLQVVGVAPPGFVGTQTGLSYDLWVPLMMVGDFYSSGSVDALLHDRSTQWLMCVGHLKPGVTVEQAQADMNVLMHQIATQFPKSTPVTSTYSPARSGVRHSVRITICTRSCFFFWPFLASCCCSLAPTSPTFSLCALSRAAAKWPFVSPSAPRAGASFVSYSRKA